MTFKNCRVQKTWTKIPNLLPRFTYGLARLTLSSIRRLLASGNAFEFSSGTTSTQRCRLLLFDAE